MAPPSKCPLQTVLLSAFALCCLNISPPFQGDIGSNLTLSRARVMEAITLLDHVIKAMNVSYPCQQALQYAQGKLYIAHGHLIAKEDDADKLALHELEAVESSLDACTQSMYLQRSVNALQVRASLRHLSRSIGVARKLIQMENPILLLPTPKSKEVYISTMVPLKDNTNYDSNINNSDMILVPHSTNSNIMLSPQISSWPLFSFMADFCPDHVLLHDNSATLRLDRACGAKIHSTTEYYSGMFSAQIRTPMKADGVINSFYIASGDKARDSMSFDFWGKYPNRIFTSYNVNRDGEKSQQMFILPFNTCDNFHTYTITWDGESIIWMVDKIVLRIETKKSEDDHMSKYLRNIGSIHFSMWDASSMDHGAYTGSINWAYGPFLAYYKDIRVVTPFTPSMWSLPISDNASLVELMKTPLAIDYCFANIITSNDIAIVFDQHGCGGRIRTLHKYKSGTFSGLVKCATGNTSGIVTSFYLSSEEGSEDQDEVDFEWLGKDKTYVQTNFYVNGKGGNEEIIELGFDCSQAFHKYTIAYNRQRIQWLIDDHVVRTVMNREHKILDEYESRRHNSSSSYPMKATYLYASVWNASSVRNGTWSGRWAGLSTQFIVYYSNLTIESPYIQ